MPVYPSIHASSSYVLIVVVSASQLSASQQSILVTSSSSLHKHVKLCCGYVCQLPLLATFLWVALFSHGTSRNLQGVHQFHNADAACESVALVCYTAQELPPAQLNAPAALDNFGAASAAGR